MPQTAIVFYQDEKGVPVLDWLKGLRKHNRQAYAKCVARLRQLALLGYELRRPAADYLEDGVYELRAKKGRVNFRIFYFFHGRNAAVLAHAITKEDKIPHEDLKRPVERKRLFERNPGRHTFEENL